MRITAIRSMTEMNIFTAGIAARGRMLAGIAGRGDSRAAGNVVLTEGESEAELQQEVTRGRGRARSTDIAVAEMRADSRRAEEPALVGAVTVVAVTQAVVTQAAGDMAEEAGASRLG